MVTKNIDTYTKIVDQILIDSIDPSALNAKGVKDIASYNHL